MFRAWMILLIVAALAVCGCAKPKILTSQTFNGEKTLKTYMTNSPKQAGQVAQDIAAAAGGMKGGSENLFDFYMRICDFDDLGAEINCKDTLVLKYVSPQSIY